MIWTIVLLLLGFVAIGVLNARRKDNIDLSEISIEQKFKTIFSMLNQHAFSGEGEITIQNKRNALIYLDCSNQMIEINYYSGTLNVLWKFKYIQKEVVYKDSFYESRNLSQLQQQKIADKLISEMETKIHILIEEYNVGSYSPQKVLLSFPFQTLNMGYKNEQFFIEFENIENENYILDIDLDDVPTIKIFESGRTIGELIGSIPIESSFIAFPPTPGILNIQSNGDVLISGWGENVFIKNQIEQLEKQAQAINSSKNHLYRFVVQIDDLFQFLDLIGNSALNAINNEKEMKEYFEVAFDDFVLVKKIDSNVKEYEFDLIPDFYLDHTILDKLKSIGWVPLKDSKLLQSDFEDFNEEFGKKIEEIW